MLGVCWRETSFQEGAFGFDDRAQHVTWWCVTGAVNSPSYRWVPWWALGQWPTVRNPVFMSWTFWLGPAMREMGKRCISQQALWSTSLAPAAPSSPSCPGPSCWRKNRTHALPLLSSLWAKWENAANLNGRTGKESERGPVCFNVRGRDSEHFAHNPPSRIGSSLRCWFVLSWTVFDVMKSRWLSLTMESVA